MDKIPLHGIGMKLKVIGGIFLIITCIIHYIFYPFFCIKFIPYLITLTTGIILLASGIPFSIIATIDLIKAYNSDKLITTGLFSISRNPMYGSFMIFIIPGISFILNSWLVLTGSLLIYILVRIFIKEEETYLEKRYGKEYLDYKNKVGLFFPKIIRKK